MSTATVGTSIITHSTIEQRAAALVGLETLLPDTIENIKAAITTSTIEEYRTTSMWAALNNRQRKWVEAEFDLKTCPAKEGDVIEVLRDNANMALVSAGTPTVIDRLDVGQFHTGPMMQPQGTIRREGWYFERSNFRVVPSPDSIPPFPMSHPGFSWDPLYAMVRQAVREYDTTCDCTQCLAMRGAPEDLISRLRASGRTDLWPAEWNSRGEEKAFAGQMLRWARALLVQRMFERDHTTMVLGRLVADEPTLTLDEEAPVGSPNPEPVVIEEIATPESLAARIDELTTTVERLTRQIARLSEENVRLQTWQQTAIADAEKFSEVLGDIADRRELCSEFEEAIERANRSTSVLEFKGRRREIEVEFSGTMTVPYAFSVTITVDSGEDIETAASSWWSDNMSPDEVRRNGDVQWYDASFDDDPDTTY